MKMPLSIKVNVGIIMIFGERLFELRKTKNISQEELDELLDVTHQQVSIQ